MVTFFMIQEIAFQLRIRRFKSGTYINIAGYPGIHLAAVLMGLTARGLVYAYSVGSYCQRIRSDI
jgi:hypothetical protein